MVAVVLPRGATGEWENKLSSHHKMIFLGRMFFCIAILFWLGLLFGTGYTYVCESPHGYIKERDKAIVMSCPYTDDTNMFFHADNIFSGVKLNLIQLTKTRSNLRLLHVSYKSEERAYNECLKLAQEFPTLECIRLDKDAVKGYGIPKVEIILGAPVEEVLWIDCDACFVSDPEYLFDDPGYLDTGALFWSDLLSNFEILPSIVVEYDLVTEEGKEYYDNVGFDSGLLLINRNKNKKAQAKLHEMTLNQNAWPSMGDKDLWHLAWLVTHTPFTYNPYTGFLGEFTQTNNNLCTQVKYDSRGVPIVFHQMYKIGDWKGRLPSYSKYPYIHNVLTPPVHMYKVDLRTRKKYYFDFKINIASALTNRIDDDEVSMTSNHLLQELNDMSYYYRENTFGAN